MRFFGVHHRLSALFVTGFLVLLVSLRMPSILTGALFTLSPTVSPASGVYINTGYEGMPSERGSVVLEAGGAFTSLEGISLTFVVDPARASIVRVRRTAITDDFDVSYDFPGPGVVDVALVGDPTAVGAGGDLLEFELLLADSSVNTAGNTIDLRLLDVEYIEGSTPGSIASDGLLTFTSSIDALTFPFTPFISDVDPGVIALVRDQKLTIRGKSLPSDPRVMIGTEPIPVVSSSSTEIMAMVPEDTIPGEYAVTVDSLLAEESIVVISAPDVTSSVEILDELMFIDPNPALYPDSGTDIVLWVPVFNPLGPDEPIIGSVDFSALGGDPNIVFSGVGAASVGPGGVMVNWFRIPESGTISIVEGLETNSDYPIPVRVENAAVTDDDAIALMSLRSQISLGDVPSFGAFETAPAAVAVGDDVSFYVDVSHPEGIDTIELVSLRLTEIGGGVRTLNPVLSNAQLTTVAYTLDFNISESVVPGTYFLDLVALDKDGDEVSLTVPFVVNPPGGAPIGSPPVYGTRIEARPDTVGPGADVDFFVEVADPDGTSTIKTVTIDLIDIGGSTQKLDATEDMSTVGTLPVVFETEFSLPSAVATGSYVLPVRTIDMNGLSATTSITLTVDSSLGGGGTGGIPPVFVGRLEAVPSVVPLRGKTEFFVGVSDPDGTDTIAKVTIDLIDIGGGILELKETAGAVAGSVVPEIYTGEFTLPNAVVPGVYSLDVRALDSSGNASTIPLFLTVSALVSSTNAPTILQDFSLPDNVPADGRTNVTFTIEVEDTDGVQDVVIARIDLTPLGLPVMPLTLDGSTTTPESNRGFFVSQEIQVPRTASTGSYDLLVEIEDSDGGSDSTLLSLDVGGSFGGEAPSFIDVRFVPEVGSPGGQVRLFAEVEDKNSADDASLTVVADFTDIRLDTEDLDAIINFPSGTVVTRNTFASSTLKIPEDLPVGVYDIPLTAVDDTSNIVRATARLRIERGGQTDGQPPAISEQRVFQSPPVFPNDNTNKGEIHILVSDPDDDVVAVIANFGAIGNAQGASVSGTDGLEIFCQTSRAIVCLQKSVPESLTARWFVLQGISIPPTTAGSSQPYFVEITAIDADGHTDYARVPVLIGSADVTPHLAAAPSFDLIVPVNERALELVVTPPVDTKSVARGGEQFQINPVLDAIETLNVTRASWDTSSRILYLDTDPMVPGETYIFSVEMNDPDTPVLTDIYGNRFGGTVRFTAYDGSGVPPEIESVKVVDPEHIEVTFSTRILPSSVHEDILPTNASMVSTVLGERKSVKGGALQPDGKTLIVPVDRLREGDRYMLRIKGVVAPGLIEAKGGMVEKMFVAVFPRGDAPCEGQLILPTADLNRDGHVNFSDFALFSSVYNTEHNFVDIVCSEEESDVERVERLLGGRNRPENTFGGEHPELEF